MTKNKGTKDILDFLDTLGDDPDEEDSQPEEIIPSTGETTLLGTLCEMITGMFLFGILCEIIGVWFVKDKLSCSLGLFIGVIIAALMASHMAWTFETSIDKDGKTATGRVRFQALLRYFVVLGVFAVLMLTDFANPLAAFLGVMSLKVSAYLQPLIHKIFKVLNKKK